MNKVEKIYFSLANALDVNKFLDFFKNNKIKYTYDNGSNYLTIRLHDKSKLSIIKDILKRLEADMRSNEDEHEKGDYGVILIDERILENNKVLMFNDFINEGLILEKSSLTALGVPTDVMKSIQKDLALSSDAKWEKINHKYEIDSFLKRGIKSLFLQININAISVIVCYPTIKGIEFFVDRYKYVDDDWTGGYTKSKRVFPSYTQTMFQILPKSNIYRLEDDFSIIKQVKRQAIRKETQFNEFTEKFKKEFLKKFDAILKRITGAKFKDAKGKIAEKAKQIALENKMLIQSLDNPLEGPNGLSIMDEFLYQFEEEYSEFFSERLDLQELCEYFTRDKVFTMLMYYIYTGKKMN